MSLFVCVCTCSMEITDIFPHLKKTLMLPFSWTVFEQDLLNLAQDLHFQCRFDDLDFVSRLQMYQMC